MNLLGLSAAIFVFFVVAIQIKFDTTFNGCFKKSKNIYQLITNQDGNFDRNALISSVNAILSAAPEIKNTALVKTNFSSGIYIINEKGEKISFAEKINVVNKGFIELFEPKIVEGNSIDLLSGTDKLLLSEQTAKRLFGKVSPIGKTVFYNKAKLEKTDNMTRTVFEFTPGIVAAVYKDFPKNTTFDNVILSIEEPSENYVYESYFEIDKPSLETIAKKINTKEIFNQVAFFIDGGHISYDGKDEKEIDVFKEIKIEPIRNIQTRYPKIVSRGSDIKVVYFMMAIGFFVLIIAYINFINFSAALAPVRMRSINIQRILGAEKQKLRFVICSEAILFSLLASVVALVGLYVFNSSNLIQMFTADFSIAGNWQFLLVMVVLLLFVSMLVGVYPAYYITKIKTSLSANAGSGKQQSSNLRYSLIVLQFVAAIMLTSIALSMKTQLDFMQNYNTGIEKDNILYVKNNTVGDKSNVTSTKVFAQEVTKNTSITDYTLSSIIPGVASNNFVLSFMNGEEFRYNQWNVDNRFPQFFGITISEGKSFGRSDNSEKILVNRAFVDKHKIEGIIGKQFMSPDFTHNIECSGVVNDFNFEPLTTVINPLMLTSLRDETLNYVFFKVQPQYTKDAIAYIENVWKRFSDEPIEVNFLDKIAEKQYKMETNLSNLVSIASLIIILIAIMGVYGLIIFSTKSKSKEIAIRKINGANESNIIQLVNRNLMVQFGLAFMLSVVPAYMIIEKWLEQFPYKMDIHWWIFAMAGLLVALITFATVSWQSWRAATANPVESLKSE